MRDRGLRPFLRALFSDWVARFAGPASALVTMAGLIFNTPAIPP